MTFTGRTGTILLVVLIASLCVNLLLAGMMVGGRWHDRPHRFVDRFPADVRPVMEQVFETHRAEFDARREAIQEARVSVAELLKAESIDQARLDQAMSAYMQESMAMRQFGLGVMVEIAQKLPPDLRRQMADQWAKDRFGRKHDSD